MAIADADRYVATMLGNNVIEQRNRAGMQSQRIFNRLCKLDHVPSHDVAHSAGKPSHVVVIVALDACRDPPEARLESASRYLAGVWVAVSQRALFGKPQPTLDANSGSQFPLSGPSGKPIPLWVQILGRSFRDAQSTYALATPAHKKRGKAHVLPSLQAICSRLPTSGAG